jgi:hypothetical protein
MPKTHPQSNAVKGLRLRVFRRSWGRLGGTGARHRPCFLSGAGNAVAWKSCASLERTEGARNTTGPGGPTGLNTSRRLGLSIEPVFAPFGATTGKPQVRLLRGVPRAVFVRFAPLRPRWTAISGGLRYRRALNHRFGPGRVWHPLAGCVVTHRQRGPCGARSWVRRDGAAWTAGEVTSAASPTPTPGHRSPPRVRRCLIRHPSVTRRDEETIIIGLWSIYGGRIFFMRRHVPLQPPPLAEEREKNVTPRALRAGCGS